MSGIKSFWNNYSIKHPQIAQFIMFVLLSNGITVFQMILMPVLKAAFSGTALEAYSFQILPVGHNSDGSPYYIFNYPLGSISSGGGGGLAYFIAVQLTLGIAQVINFFAQRNITFRSKGNIYKAAVWYLIAYILITICAGALQGWYKDPIYQFFIDRFGRTGETAADLVTMIINAAISFWVYFPILKIIFREDKKQISA
ncbi:hypothetical protein [Paenibacillus sp. FSL R7-0331]|uniref:hypothetical protein n=1 Tax=Paenibacillus sp. FSL R7-0331 TaxID=1536773 RepID=UPI0004F650BE|nr:hypothetical protein [Paenibacillus sp. FSL R7-0331]AIQ51429.1 hypothetical protein R70331_07835 [Paenibacillus sp. FSL R7-0331]